MSRREIVSFMGGMAAVWPPLAYAQQNGRTRRVAGVRERAWHKGVLPRLQQAGRAPGRDVQMDVC
jgi:hypothetical protein